MNVTGVQRHFRGTFHEKAARSGSIQNRRRQCRIRQTEARQAVFMRNRALCFNMWNHIALFKRQVSNSQLSARAMDPGQTRDGSVIYALENLGSDRLIELAKAVKQTFHCEDLLQWISRVLISTPCRPQHQSKTLIFSLVGDKKVEIPISLRTEAERFLCHAAIRTLLATVNSLRNR